MYIFAVSYIFMIFNISKLTTLYLSVFDGILLVNVIIQSVTVIHFIEMLSSAKFWKLNTSRNCFIAQ